MKLELPWMVGQLIWIGWILSECSGSNVRPRVETRLSPWLATNLNTVSVVASLRGYKPRLPFLKINRSDTDDRFDRKNDAFLAMRGGATAHSQKRKRSSHPIKSPAHDNIPNQPAAASSLPLPQNRKGNKLIVRKLRNIIRSLLEITEKKNLGFAHKTLRSIFGTLESILGVWLLPPPGELKRKKFKSESTKKKKSKERNEHDAVEQAPKQSVVEKAAPPHTQKSEIKNVNKKKKATKTKPAKKSSASQSSSSLSTAAKMHLQNDLKATNPNYRIQRELKAFVTDPPPNLSVKVGTNLRIWVVTMKGAPNTIYEGETFLLRISFPPQYPTVPPSVYFLPPNIPLHEHVYTNGDICLSLLGKDWRPTMTAQSIAVSILSILSSAQSKALPMDNARHAQNKPGQYQKGWVYHDDNC